MRLRSICSIITRYDFMVHKHPDKIEHYVERFATLLESDGALWVDQSGKDATVKGHRAAMKEEVMAQLDSASGLKLLSRNLRHGRDCSS